MNKNYLFVLCASFMLTSCSERVSTRYYLLEPQAQTALIKPNAPPRVIALLHVQLPSLLQTQQIVTHEANQVQLAELNRWAEPLEDNFKRVLAENLRALLPNAVIQANPSVQPVDYQLILDIDRFDGVLAGDVLLTGQWSILHEQKVMTQGQTRLKHGVNAKDYMALTQAMSELLSRLSQQLALVLRELH